MEIKILPEDHVAAGRRLAALLANELTRSYAECEALRREILVVDYVDVPTDSPSEGTPTEENDERG